MDVSLQNSGREVVVTTPKGQYTAYGPLEPNREKFDVKTPTGEIVKMNQSEFLKFIVQNAPELERSPKQDAFVHS